MKKSDAELIDEILSGDEDAFSALVQKYQKSVHALVWRKIGDFHIAEEITQDTFLHVYKKLPTLKNPRQFAGWLYVIVNRQCIAWLRKNNIQAEQSLEATSQETLEETAYACFVLEKREETEVERRREVVDRLLGKLPESERTVVILHYLGEMSCDAIGKFLGVSPNTVKSRLSRARNRLRENESFIRDTLGSVKLSPNLSDNIMREIGNVSQISPSGTKPLLPLASLGSSVLLVILLIGASNKYLTHFQLPYSFDALSEITIEIVESPVELNITPKLDVQNQYGNDAAHGKSNNEGLKEGKTSMQNNLAQDSVYWKLPEGAKARLGKGYVYRIKYSPDGNLLAVSGTIGIWIYDAHTGEEHNLLLGHGLGGVPAIAFSPNNQLLASGGRDKTIRLWDPNTGQHKATFIGHQDAVYSVAFSPNGKTLASCGEDETIRMWDVATGELRFTFAGHAGGVSEVIYSPDGDLLGSYGWDEMIHMWDAHTGKYLRSLDGQTGNINTIAFSLNGEMLASGCAEGAIKFWDINTGQTLTTLQTASDYRGVSSVSFTPDGRTFVSTNYEDDVIQFWDVATCERIKTIESPPDTTEKTVFSPDGKTLVNAGGDGTIQFWNVDTLASIRTLTGYANMFTDMAYSHDGNTLAIVSSMERLLLWNTRTGKLMKTYLSPYGSLFCIAFSPDGVTLACGGNMENAVWFINTETLEHGHNFKGPKGNVESVAFSPDGQLLACGDSDGNIYLWNAATGETIKILEWHDDYVRTLEFSTDGKMLVSTSDAEIRFWDVTTGKTLKKVSGYEVSLSPDWQTFVTVGSDRMVKYWNMDQEDPLKTISPEEKSIFPRYSPDGRTYTTIDYGGETISFWNAETSEILKTYSIGHTKSIWSEGIMYKSYSPDGRTFATAGWDSTILLWGVPK